MSRLVLTVAAGFPNRLRRVIAEAGFGHQTFIDQRRAFAAAAGLADKNVARYLRGGTADAEAHRKLAHALGPRLFYWVVTGEHPEGWDERTRGGLPPLLRELVATAQDLPSDRQDALVTCAKLLHGNHESGVVKAIMQVIQTFSALLQRGEEIHPDTPFVPDLPPPS